MIGNAVKVMRIATGEESDIVAERSHAAELGSRGGAARSKVLTKERRREIAKAAAKQRGGG